MARAAVVLLALAAAAAAVLAVGTGAPEPPPRAAPDGRAGAPREPARRAPAPGRRRRHDRDADVPRARCPAGVPDCAAVRGRVLYVEPVDPDGDGDLHVVVRDGDVTAPGMTAVDVRPDLRPRRDPRVGDPVSAAGPVQRGSLGQKQIHALAFHAGRG